nr:hypothetical protein Iba_chr12aCG12840 [Ipomoea batatas]
MVAASFPPLLVFLGKTSSYTTINIHLSSSFTYSSPSFPHLFSPQRSSNRSRTEQRFPFSIRSGNVDVKAGCEGGRHLVKLQDNGNGGLRCHHSSPARATQQRRTPCGSPLPGCDSKTQGKRNWPTVLPLPPPSPARAVRSGGCFDGPWLLFRRAGHGDGSSRQRWWSSFRNAATVKAAAWLEEARWRHGPFSLLPANLAMRVDYDSSSSSGGVFHSLTPAVSGCDVDGRRRHQAFPFSGESKARRNRLLCSRSQFSFMMTGSSVEG